MFVFGGLVESVGAVQELWKYSLDSGRWSQLQVSKLLLQALQDLLHKDHSFLRWNI